ncbi:hypothetical protein [Sulfuriroseicoccus oceanibius]|uniref:Uncharacterized protein n=1 Tax=Sulfuriroseicoccus oceanibius TaxID=2707525 RepID=A0A6B3L7K5_9BACT|nr:hypothetical protein [Sulfuriroseicoccus oceanibius]QQL43710.1 hypothetical protein G3M56_007300 [Sulfuriroseicoccus oceanibius]
MPQLRQHPVKALRSLLAGGPLREGSLREFAKQLKGINFSQVGRVERYELPVSKQLSTRIQQQFGAWIAPGHYYPGKNTTPVDQLVPLKPDHDFIPRNAFGADWKLFHRRSEFLGRGLALHVQGGEYRSIDELAEDCCRLIQETRGIRGSGQIRVFPSALHLEPYTRDSYDAFQRTHTDDALSENPPSTPLLDDQDVYLLSLLPRLLAQTRAAATDAPEFLALKEALRGAACSRMVKDAQYRAIESFCRLFVLNSDFATKFEETPLEKLMWANKIWTHPGEIPSSRELLDWFNRPSQADIQGCVDYEEQGMPAPLWLQNYRLLYPQRFDSLMQSHPIDRRILGKADYFGEFPFLNKMV